MRRALALAAGLLGWVTGAAPGQDGSLLRRPEAESGPYRVLIERIADGQNLFVDYHLGDGGELQRRRLEGRRTVQLQLKVTADSPEAVAGLTSLEVLGISVRHGGRTLDLAHSGGRLDGPDRSAVVRAYVLLSSVPLSLSTLESLSGELVSYEVAQTLTLRVPTAGPLPRTVEQEGIRATLHGLVEEGRATRCRLTLEAPEGSLLLSPVGDGTFGVSLHNAEGREASPAGGRLAQNRKHEAEYQVAFRNVPGEPDFLRVRVLYRGGARRIHPFRLEEIPLPGGAGGRRADEQGDQ